MVCLDFALIPILSAIRRGFTSLVLLEITIQSYDLAIIRVLTPLNNPKALHPSNKTDLDFGDWFWKVNSQSNNRRNTVYKNNVYPVLSNVTGPMYASYDAIHEQFFIWSYRTGIDRINNCNSNSLA